MVMLKSREKEKSAGFHSSAPGFRWTSDWDIISVRTQEPTPMSDTPNPGERGRFSAPRRGQGVGLGRPASAAPRPPSFDGDGLHFDGDGLHFDGDGLPLMATVFL
jgi:hypothetical protein